jgi:hypothetical protein
MRGNKKYVCEVSFEVLTAVRMMMFWVLTQCRLVGRYQHFGETYYLQVQSFSPNPSQNPEEQHRNPHRHDNLKSHHTYVLFVSFIRVTFHAHRSLLDFTAVTVIKKYEKNFVGET